MTFIIKYNKMDLFLEALFISYNIKFNIVLTKTNKVNLYNWLLKNFNQFSVGENLNIYIFFDTYKLINFVNFLNTTILTKIRKVYL